MVVYIQENLWVLLKFLPLPQLILVYHKILLWFETEIQTSETSIGNVVDFEWTAQ